MAHSHSRLDPKDLNKGIKRVHYRIPTAEDVASTLAGKKLFSILDEKDGYWQVELDEESFSVHIQFAIWVLQIQTHAIWDPIGFRSFSVQE